MKEFRATVPGVRVHVPLSQRLVVGPQRFFVLVRRREDIAPQAPCVWIVRIDLDHPVEATEGALRFSGGEVREGLALQRVLPIRIDPEGAIVRGLGLVGLVFSAMGISLPHPEFGVLRTQREDPRISIRIVRV